MQLESHSTPPVETPEQRYATLHRAIERGIASDEVWKELAEVSVRLGHADEAVGCLQHIKGETVRRLLESRLRRLGLLTADSDPSSASASGDAATAAANDAERTRQPRLTDHVADAVQYLAHQHMPWLVLVTTLAFPLVVGVGGMLTAGKSPWLLAAIAALPGLCVLTLVGVMGRQILLASSEGNGDVPLVPAFGDLIADARRFVVDATLVLGSMIVPPFVAMALGAPLSTTLPGLAIGMFFTPMMWALRQVRGDRAALSPLTIMRAMARTGRSYAGIAGVSCLLFLPAVVVTCLIFGRAVWVQIAMVGPLCVVPMFVASRLLGTWLDARRGELGGLLSPTPPMPKAKAPVAAVASTAPRPPRRPDALHHFEAPVAKRRPVAADRSPTRAQSGPARRAPAPAGAPAPAALADGRRTAANASVSPTRALRSASNDAPAPSRAAVAAPRSHPVRVDAGLESPRASAPRRTTAPLTGPRPPAAQSTPRAATPRQKAAPPASPATAKPPVARPRAPAKPDTPSRHPVAAPPTKKPEPLAIEGRRPRPKAQEGPDLAHMPGALVVSSSERARLGAAAKKR